MENKELEPREVLFKYPQLRHLEIKVGSLEMSAIECAMREYAKEVLTASGSVAAPKEEKSEDFGKLKWKVGQILAEQFLKYNDGKFIAAIELNPATHALTEFIESENTALREALKELLPIAENYRITVDNPDWEDENFKIKAIIERARKTLNKEF